MQKLATMETDKQVCYAVTEVAKRVVGKDVESIFADMGAFWDFRKYLDNHTTLS